MPSVLISLILNLDDAVVDVMIMYFQEKVFGYYPNTNCHACVDYIILHVIRIPHTYQTYILL